MHALSGSTSQFWLFWIRMTLDYDVVGIRSHKWILEVYVIMTDKLNSIEYIHLKDSIYVSPKLIVRLTEENNNHNLNEVLFIEMLQ